MIFVVLQQHLRIKYQDDHPQTLSYRHQFVTKCCFRVAKAKPHKDETSIWSLCKSNYMNPRLPRTGEISISNFFPHGKWILLINSFLRKLGPSWKWEGWCYLQTPRGLTANCSFKGAGLERPFHRPNWPMGGRLEWGEDFDQSQATIVATSMTRVPRSGWWRDRLWPRLHRLTLTPVITRG